MNTIMVVDDDPAIREIFCAYLGMHGYTTLAAAGGTECLDLLKAQKPDLILLDLMMEPMDGWETLLAIRHNPSSHDIPVIIITGKQPAPEEIIRYGGFIEDFIVKPVDFSLVVACLNRIIEKDRTLHREIDRIGNDRQDPELLDEYTRLLRLLRSAHILKKRYSDRGWADRILLARQEERLLQLHKKFNLPDTLLDRNEGG